MRTHWLSRYQIVFYKPVPIKGALIGCLDIRESFINHADTMRAHWLSRYQREFYKPVPILCAFIACLDIGQSIISRYRYYARSLGVQISERVL